MSRTKTIDTRTASREDCHAAFQQARQGILREITRLHTDVKSINENRFTDDPILILLDFRDDIAEFDAWTVHQRNEFNYPTKQGKNDPN